MLVVVPPEYFPRPAFLALLDGADRCVLADTYQYSRQSFQNRARLRTPQGQQWITIPLKGGQHGLPIREVAVEHREPWARKHWRSLEYNYRSSPYFELYEPELAPLFKASWRNLGEFTCATTVQMMDLLGIETDVEVASALPSAPGDLAGIAEAAGGGPMLFHHDHASHDDDLPEEAGIVAYEERPYRQNFEGFQSGMSALDLLFNLGPGALGHLRAGIVMEEFDVNLK